jgi:hypothetical protein
MIPGGQLSLSHRPSYLLFIELMYCDVEDECDQIPTVFTEAHSTVKLWEVEQ